MGDITLTATWEPTVYTISYNSIRGETAGTNPESYTIEDDDIVLFNPAADGYELPPAGRAQALRARPKRL